MTELMAKATEKDSPDPSPSDASVQAMGAKKEGDLYTRAATAKAKDKKILQHLFKGNSQNSQKVSLPTK